MYSPNPVTCHRTHLICPAWLQEALELRDAEIQRLTAQVAKGPDVDQLAQQYRNDANEAVILQLNQQVNPGLSCGWAAGRWGR